MGIDSTLIDAESAFRSRTVVVRCIQKMSTEASSRKGKINAIPAFSLPKDPSRRGHQVCLEPLEHLQSQYPQN